MPASLPITAPPSGTGPGATVGRTQLPAVQISPSGQMAPSHASLHVPWLQ